MKHLRERHVRIALFILLSVLLPVHRNASIQLQYTIIYLNKERKNTFSNISHRMLATGTFQTPHPRRASGGGDEGGGKETTEKIIEPRADCPKGWSALVLFKQYGNERLLIPHKGNNLISVFGVFNHSDGCSTVFVSNTFGVDFIHFVSNQIHRYIPMRQYCCGGFGYLA